MCAHIVFGIFVVTEPFVVAADAQEKVAIESSMVAVLYKAGLAADAVR